MILAGYHAIVTRFKIAPTSISKLFVVDRRNDFKVKNLFQLAKKNNVQVIRVSSLELTRLTMNKKNTEFYLLDLFSFYWGEQFSDQQIYVL